MLRIGSCRINIFLIKVSLNFVNGHAACFPTHVQVTTPPKTSQKILIQVGQIIYGNHMRPLQN